MQSNMTSSGIRGWRRLMLSASTILAALLLMGAPALAAGESPRYNEKLDKLPASPAADVPFSPLRVGSAVPAVSAPDAPSSVLLGEPIDFTFEFWNNSGDSTDVGYGPFVDVLFGPGLNCNTATATYLGQPLVKAGTVTDGGHHPLQYDITQPPNNPAGVIMDLPAGSCVAVWQLPFGSVVTTQPHIEISVSVPMQVPPAEIGTPIDIATRGGFQFGSLTALNDWCCGDSPIVSAPADDQGVSWPTTPVTPRLMDVTKTVDAPPVTGPNWPGHYYLSVDIAQSQTLTDVTITDTLPDNIQYTGYAITKGTGTCATTPDPITDPGGEIACTFASANGGTDIEVRVDFYVPLEDAGTASVLDPDTGDLVTIDNTYTMDAMWDPDGGGGLPAEPVGGTCETPCTDGSFDAKSIAVQKDGGQYWNDPATDPGLTPEDVVQYTLTFQVSDYFAFDGIVLTDVLGDGIEFIIDDPASGAADTDLAPTLTITEGGSTVLNDVTFALANYTNAPITAEADGTSIITFNVSDQMVTSGEDANLIGGCVDELGITPPSQVCGGNSAPATGVVTFYGRVLENYRYNPGGGFDPSVDHADVIPNNVTIEGDVQNNVGLTDTGYKEDDSASAPVTITQGELTKTVWQINGSPVGANPTASPGDEVTFRLEYTLPSTDTELLAFEDWIPLPMFSVADPDADGSAGPAWSFNNSICGVPAPGEACFGPTDTFKDVTPDGVGVDGVPTLTQDDNGNSLKFDYGTYDGNNTEATKVDLVFTLVVTDDPFTDLLQINNQARSYESNTQGTPANQDKLSPLEIGEPVMVTEKAVVALWDQTVHVPPPGPVLGNWRTPDADPTNQRWISGPLTWGGGLPNNNGTETEPYDVLTYAIFISNQGHSDKGAFDIQIKDTLDTASFQFPSGGSFPEGLNLQVRYGDGTVIPHFLGDPLVDLIPVTSWYGLGGGPDATDNTIDDIFGNGIEILDPDPQVIGACEAESLVPGHSLIVITYDLEILPGVGAGSTLTNTSELFNYSNTEGGVDYTDEFGGQDAGITASASATIRIDTSKTGDPAGPLTVGDFYIQTIKASISGQTFAEVRTGFTVNGPPTDPVVGADDTIGTAIPDGIRLRDRILTNGALPILDQATFTADAACPAFVQAWTVRTALNPLGEVQVFGIDNRQSNGSPGGDEYHVYWVIPAINNAQDPECKLTVTIPVYIVDDDPGIPPGRFFLPPATNVNVEDRARLEYVVNSQNLNTVEKTYTTTVQQPQMSATKTLLAVYTGPGPIPNSQDLLTGLRDTDGAPFTDIRRGDVVRWALGLENVGHNTAHEVTLADTLPIYVQYVNGSAFIDDGAGIGGIANNGIREAGEASINPNITGNATTTGQTLTFTLPSSIAEAEVVTVVFQSQVMNSMPLGPLADLIKQNFADIDWSTMAGNQPGERLYDDRYDVGGVYYDIAGDGNQDDDTDSFTLLGLTLDKGFNPVAIPNQSPANTSTLTFTLSNPNTIPLTGVAFTDQLPNGLTYLTTPVISGPECVGGLATVNTAGNNRVLTVSGLTVSPAPALPGPTNPGICTITVDVTGTLTGVYDNETSPVTSNETGPGESAKASLVISSDLGMHKQFTPSDLDPGETATITFTLINTTDRTMVQVEFFEFLPIGSPTGRMEVANPANATNGCGGTWNPQPGDIDLRFENGMLLPNSFCEITVDVTATENATYVNRVDPNGNSLLTSGLPSTSPTLVDLDTLLGPYTPVEALELGLIGRGDAVFTAIYEDTGGRVLLIDTTPSNDARLRVRARRAGEGEVFGAPLLPELPETLPSTGGVMAALLGLPLLLVVLVGGSAVLFALAKRRRRV